MAMVRNRQEGRVRRCMRVRRLLHHDGISGSAREATGEFPGKIKGTGDVMAKLSSVLMYYSFALYVLCAPVIRI